MAIDPVALCTIDLYPTFAADTTLEAQIPAKVEAEIALQGWDSASLTDQQAVYIAALATQSFIPRLLLFYGQEVVKAKGGKAETEFAKMIDYLKVLKSHCEDIIKRAAGEADPGDIELTADRWVGLGPLGF